MDLERARILRPEDERLRDDSDGGLRVGHVSANQVEIGEQLGQIRHLRREWAGRVIAGVAAGVERR